MAERTIRAKELKELLDKARADPTFRDRLLSSPADTLRGEDMKATPFWVDFFEGLNANDFEQEMLDAIDNPPVDPGEV